MVIEKIGTAEQTDSLEEAIFEEVGFEDEASALSVLKCFACVLP